MAYFNTTVVINEDDVKVEVFYRYYPAEPGRDYLSNGDIGYQYEPAEVEIETVFDEHGEITHVLTQSQIEALENEAFKEVAKNVWDH